MHPRRDCRPPVRRDIPFILRLGTRTSDIAFPEAVNIQLSQRCVISASIANGYGIREELFFSPDLFYFI